MPQKLRAREQALAVCEGLKREHPEPRIELDFSTPLELLVATILSAQCTDERVNRVTRKLFEKYRSAADYAAVSQSDLELDIKSTGFFRNKAKNIRACCRKLDEEHEGRVPRDLDPLPRAQVLQHGSPLLRQLGP